ncbi:MAG: YegP family protein [bacterium]
MGKYVIRKTKTGIKFDLLATNGQVIGTSEVFTSKAACQKSIASVTKNAPIAGVEDQTVEGYEVLKNPKFVIYNDKRGEQRFKLQARNGKNILASEGYRSMKNCVKGVESVKKNANSPTIEKPE